MLKIGLHILPGPSPSAAVEIAVLADQNNFNSVWYTDHPVTTTFGPVVDIEASCSEVWTVLGAMSVRTKRVTIGPAVLSGTARHPFITAQAAATLDRLSGGRAVLGVGAGLPWEIEPFGLDTSLLVSRLREAIIVIRKLLNEPKVNFQGRFYRLKGAGLGIKCIQKPHLPILLAAKGPRMMEIGAEFADGFILGFPASPETCREYCEEATRLFKDKGRFGLPDTVAIGRMAISDTVEEATRALQGGKNLIVRAPREVERVGFTGISSELRRRLSEAVDIGRASVELSHLIPNEVLERLCIAGPPEECIRRLEEYAEAGIKHIILADYSPNPKQTMEIFGREVIPRVQQL